MRVFAQFFRDERGFLVSSELVLLAVLVVIGLASGLATIRDQVVSEIGDVADAISETNQSYSFSGISGHTATVAGSIFSDLADYCESAGSAADQLVEVGTTQGINIESTNASPE